MTTLAHSAQFTRPIIVTFPVKLDIDFTVNLDVTLLFWPLFALVWLAWLMLTGLGRRVRAWGSWRAGVVEDLGQALAETWGTLVLMLCPMGQMVAG